MVFELALHVVFSTVITVNAPLPIQGSQSFPLRGVTGGALAATHTTNTRQRLWKSTSSRDTRLKTYRQLSTLKRRVKSTLFSGPKNTGAHGFVPHLFNGGRWGGGEEDSELSTAPPVFQRHEIVLVTCNFQDNTRHKSTKP
jgi:hypothetical protein